MEAEFRRYIRDLLLKNGVFSLSVEHRSGGSVGAPDLLVLDHTLLLPVELKVASYDQRAELFHPETIRPAQIKLLDELVWAGGRVRLLLGVHDFRGWSGYLLRDVRAERLKIWRRGFPEAWVNLVARRGDLLLPVDKW